MYALGWVLHNFIWACEGAKSCPQCVAKVDSSPRQWLRCGRRLTERKAGKGRLSVTQIIVTVCCTVAGSVAIAFTIFRLQRNAERRKLFKALYSEIGLNRSIAKEQVGKPDLVFDLSPFYTLAYQNIRATGELLALPRVLRQQLEEAYEMIYAHNRQLPAAMEILPRNRGFYEGAGKIAKKLESLQKEMPKCIKCLR